MIIYNMSSYILIICLCSYFKRGQVSSALPSSQPSSSPSVSLLARPSVFPSNEPTASLTLKPSGIQSSSASPSVEDSNDSISSTGNPITAPNPAQDDSSFELSNTPPPIVSKDESGVQPEVFKIDLNEGDVASETNTTKLRVSLCIVASIILILQ